MKQNRLYMPRCRRDGAKTWVTKEFQADLLGFGKSLAYPSESPTAASYWEIYRGYALTSFDGWLDGTSRSAMYGKGGPRKGRVAVRICRSCHPFQKKCL